MFKILNNVNINYRVIFESNMFFGLKNGVFWKFLKVFEIVCMCLVIFFVVWDVYRCKEDFIKYFKNNMI